MSYVSRSAPSPPRRAVGSLSQIGSQDHDWGSALAAGEAAEVEVRCRACAEPASCIILDWSYLFPILSETGLESESLVTSFVKFCLQVDCVPPMPCKTKDMR